MTPIEAITTLRTRPEALLAVATIQTFLIDSTNEALDVTIDEERGVVRIDAQSRRFGHIWSETLLQELGPGGEFWSLCECNDGTTDLIYSENVRHGLSGASAAAERIIRGEQP